MKPNQKPGFFRLLWELLYPFLAYQLISTVVSVVICMLILSIDLSTVISSAGDANAMVLALSELVTDNYIPICAVSVVLSLPLLVFFYRNDRLKEKAAKVFTEYEKTSVFYYLIAFITGAAACFAVNNLMIFSRLSELLYDGYETTAELLFQGNLILEIAVAGILIPLAEELIFRGLVYKRMRWYLNALPAMILSAVFFGAVHGNWLQGIYAFILGMLLAFVYERFQNVAAPVALHAGANILSVAISETGVLDFIYEDDTAFLIATAAAIVLFAAVFYLIAAHVYPKKKREPASAPDGPSDGR